MRLLFQISFPLLSSGHLSPFHRQHLPMKLPLRFSLSLVAACCFSEWQQIAFFMQAWWIISYLSPAVTNTTAHHNSLQQGQPGFNTTVQKVRSECGSTRPGWVLKLRNRVSMDVWTPEKQCNLHLESELQDWKAGKETKSGKLRNSVRRYLSLNRH